MAEQILEGVSPTRMDLLEIRKKLVLAEKGHKLLEEKRDALVEKFFEVIDKRNQLSKELDEDFKSAYMSLIRAQMILGERKVEDAAYLTQDIGEIKLNDKIYVKEGDSVKAGDIILELEQTEYRAGSTAAYAGYRSAQSNLESAEVTWRAAKEAFKDIGLL